MPELPDVTIYVERLRAMVGGHCLERIDITSPFLLRSVDPSPDLALGRTLHRVERIGKRIALGFDPDPWLVIHLMVAGRLRLKPAGSTAPRNTALAELRFSNSTLFLTEAGRHRRASLHVVRSPDLRSLDPGGLEVMDCSAEAFRDRLFSQRHTLKRALTDPRLFSGIGNAFSDEILHRARLSPLQITTNLAHEEASRLHRATIDTLTDWTARIRHEVGDGFPDRVTAYRNGMAVHGRYGQPCPICGTAVQRIVYVRTEVNYCPRCQTGGRILADRAFSRILRDDWPRTIEEWEGLGSSKA